MTSVFVLFFVVILGPTHSNFEDAIARFGAPVLLSAEKYTTREECLANLKSLLDLVGHEKNRTHIHMAEGSCKEFSYPTRPETGV